MTIENKEVLKWFRQSRICEWCMEATPGGCEPHHWSAKGLSSGKRLDVSINLLSVCSWCHRKLHDGNIDRGLLLGVIAARHGTTADAIQEVLWFLQRTPNGTSVERIEAALAGLDCEVERLARAAMEEGGML